MRTRALSILLALILIPFVLFAGGNTEQDSKPIVMVSILPHAYFVDQIAGDLVETAVLVGEGQNPHSYEPSPSQMARLAKASIWILSGTDFEHALIDKVSSLYPDLVIIDGTEGMILRTLEEHDHEDEEAGEDEAVHDLNIDRHTWLGWEQSKVLVKNISTALTTYLGLPEAELEERAGQLLSQIEGEFSSLEAELAGLSGSTVFVYHPSFGYFLDSFGLHQEAVETGGKEPTAKDLALLIERAQDDQAKVIFVQKQFPSGSAEKVAQVVGAQVVPLDPLAYDWLGNIRLMGNALKESL
ncbi:metal ABC transporter solute-binding protein, Zn/Mn family [uncultured Sphaerochaeta sp.]|uniref:metal ABC transporter solute-binding protein, Zn/Mn family n=1 Tax=uncultured Sphaerochaeta sp. TaxID=886478 RepID=UPI002A0A50F7|nr:zinc ABC transporter substrate-binding protein [uncultured Sphaerochaeta sp.]